MLCVGVCIGEVRERERGYPIRCTNGADDVAASFGTFVFCRTGRRRYWTHTHTCGRNVFKKTKNQYQDRASVPERIINGCDKSVIQTKLNIAVDT